MTLYTSAIVRERPALLILLCPSMVHARPARVGTSQLARRVSPWCHPPNTRTVRVRDATPALQWRLSRTGRRGADAGFRGTDVRRPRALSAMTEGSVCSAATRHERRVSPAQHPSQRWTRAHRRGRGEREGRPPADWGAVGGRTCSRGDTGPRTCC